jgi:hypothetical protein
MWWAVRPTVYLNATEFVPGRARTTPSSRSCGPTSRGSGATTASTSPTTAGSSASTAVSAAPPVATASPAPCGPPTASTPARLTTAASSGCRARRSRGAPQVSFFRNRYYDAFSGRFPQEDPIGHAGGTKLYAYSSNAPGRAGFGRRNSCIVTRVPWGPCDWVAKALGFTYERSGARKTLQTKLRTYTYGYDSEDGSLRRRGTPDLSPAALTF